MVQDVLEQVDLADQANKLPAQMSGGQRQRVALARAIVKRPKAFLMDEPLSNLDAKLRNQMRFELIDIYKKLNTTFLYVTHDQVEAMSMGTHIVLMQGGNIMQEGTPRDIYENPQNVFVAQFIGSPPANVFRLGQCSIGIRPEHVRLTTVREGRFNMPAKVHSAEQLGGETIFHITTPLGNVNMRTACNWDLATGGGYIEFPEAHILCFDHEGRRTDQRQAILRSLSAAVGSTDAKAVG